jgi:hypothetical protein
VSTNSVNTRSRLKLTAVGLAVLLVVALSYTDRNDATAQAVSGLITVSGRAYADNDNSGTYTSGDTIVGGISVVADDNDGNPLGPPATVNASGFYTLQTTRPNTPTAGPIRIRFGNIPSPMQSASAAREVQFLNGWQSYSGIDFRLYNPETYTALTEFEFEIGDRIWFDANGDGVQSAGEPGIAGVEVELTNSGFYGGTAITDESGYFLFTGDPQRANGTSAIYAPMRTFNTLELTVRGLTQTSSPLHGLRNIVNTSGDPQIRSIGNQCAGSQFEYFLSELCDPKVRIYPTDLAVASRVFYYGIDFGFAALPGFQPTPTTRTATTIASSSTTSATTTIPTTTTAPTTTTIPIVVNPAVGKGQLTYQIPKQQLNSPLMQSLAHVELESAGQTWTCAQPIVRRADGAKYVLLRGLCRPPFATDQAVLFRSASIRSVSSSGSITNTPLALGFVGGIADGDGVIGFGVCAPSGVAAMPIASDNRLLFSSVLWNSATGLRVTHSESVNVLGRWFVVHGPNTANMTDGSPVYSGFSDDISRIELRGMVSQRADNVDLVSILSPTILSDLLVGCPQGAIPNGATLINALP